MEVVILPVCENPKQGGPPMKKDSKEAVKMEEGKP